MTKLITRMEIDDAEHFTPDERQAIIDSYPEQATRRAVGALLGAEIPA